MGGLERRSVEVRSAYDHDRSVEADAMAPIPSIMLRRRATTVRARNASSQTRTIRRGVFSVHIQPVVGASKIAAAHHAGDEFQCLLVPLMASSQMGLPPFQYDFSVDPTEQALVMNMPESDFTWAATRGLAIEAILFDAVISEDC